MTETRWVAYYRVSTRQQGRSGLGLEAQKAAVMAYLGGVRPEVEVVEVESGRNPDRPRLEEALSLCRARKATLVIAKLDRLARKVSFISDLMERGVPFVAVDRPNAKPFELHIYAALAEEEARATAERTRAALAAARARGVRLGGPNAAALAPRALAALKAKAAARRANLLPLLADVRAKGATSYARMAEALTARGVRTPSGRKVWNAQAVYRVVKGPAVT